MKKIYVGVVLILMMVGHNYVINQPQSLQKQIQQIHGVTVTEFNLLYSIPSILALVFIIPFGILYHKYPNCTLIFGITILFIGQLFVSMFGSKGNQHYFSILIAGRTFEASGAQVLYMIQGNLASSWMSNLAGLIFILPEVGEIMNAFFTPFAAINWGVEISLWIGVIFCFISFVACCYLYCYLKRLQKVKPQIKMEMIDGVAKNKYNQIQVQPSFETQNRQDTASSQGEKQKQDFGSKVSSQNIVLSQQKKSQEQLTQKRQKNISQPETIFKAGRIFWLTILICAINQCLYFPFLDNANESIQMRFKIPYKQTGYFLCLPFVAAILTTIVMSRVLVHFSRRKLIFYTSFLPFIGHMIILCLPNCEDQTLSQGYKFLLGLGFFIFGTGIGGYYSVCFPAVGMAVPQKIRGLSYCVLGFFQAFAMSMIPIFSGLIIEQDITNETNGYRHSSVMFVALTLFGMVIAYLIKKYSNQFSFYYDDQAELVEEEDSMQNTEKIQRKQESGQKKLKINIQFQNESKSFG